METPFVFLCMGKLVFICFVQNFRFLFFMHGKTTIYLFCTELHVLTLARFFFKKKLFLQVSIDIIMFCQKGKRIRPLLLLLNHKFSTEKHTSDPVCSNITMF
jgi:hypothetical protein